MKNQNTAKISASMMCSHLINLSETIRIFEEKNIEFLHIDVMDGDFVPNFGLGVDYIKGLRELTKIPLDIHLMVNNPDHKFGFFGLQPTDIVSIHYESTRQLQRAIDDVKKFGCKCFLALNPSTPIYFLEEVLDYIDGINMLMVNPGFAGQQMVPSTIKKVDKLVTFLRENDKSDLELEVDGHITFDYAKLLYEKGASIFVAGKSSIFSGNMNEYSDNIDKLINSFI